MGKPTKIRKRKSFMFTTKHTSFLGVLGIVIFVFTLGVGITSTLYSFQMAGNIDISFGIIGLFGLIMNIIGVISGFISIREKDVYITPGIVAMSGNGLLIATWIVLLVLALR